MIIKCHQCQDEITINCDCLFCMGLIKHSTCDNCTFNNQQLDFRFNQNDRYYGG